MYSDIFQFCRSRHVFLRITDGKKYCYYSVYAWGSTCSMTAMALFAHLVLDTSTLRKERRSTTEAAVGMYLLYVTALVSEKVNTQNDVTWLHSHYF